MLASPSRPGRSSSPSADLSTVSIVADAFERDSPLIHVGDLLRVASAAFDGERQTRVSYLDPQVTPETRTVRVRADLPNPRRPPAPRDGTWTST